MSPRPGPLRRPINVRVGATGREKLEERAEAESGGNLSEFARRCLAYAVTRMPVGWTPETDRRKP